MDTARGKHEKAPVNLDTILEHNPALDRESIEATIEALRALRSMGVGRANTVAASPPMDPFSRVGLVRS